MLIPTSVSFTELTVNPRDLLGRKIKTPWPADWTRHVFKLPSGLQFDIALSPVDAIDRWLAANIDGRWGIYVMGSGGNSYVVLAFEDEYDAIAFRLKDGETAWYNTNQ